MRPERSAQYAGVPVPSEHNRRLQVTPGIGWASSRAADRNRISPQQVPMRFRIVP
jgi:hypothetical protein